MLGEKNGKNLNSRNSTILFLKQNPAFDLLRNKKENVNGKQKLLK